MGHIGIQDMYHQRAVLNWELKFYFYVYFMCMEKPAFCSASNITIKKLFVLLK